MDIIEPHLDVIIFKALLWRNSSIDIIQAEDGQSQTVNSGYNQVEEEEERGDLKVIILWPSKITRLADGIYFYHCYVW